MPAKSTKPRATKPTTKKTVKPQVAATKPSPFEIWRCHVEWVRHHGKKYNKGDILNVFAAILADEAEMKVIRKYFTPTKTESVAMVSEPVEILKEGD